MSTERHACGLGAILPMSCRGRAEAFARRLQTRLNNLGGNAAADDGDDYDGDADENTWLTAPDAAHFTTTRRQPAHSISSESDVYYDFDIDSPGSPPEEATEDILLNNAEAGKILEKDLESGCVSSLTATSPGSDSSDGNYYDPEAFEVTTLPPLKTLQEECCEIGEDSEEDGALDKADAVEESRETANETLIDNSIDEPVSEKEYSKCNGDVAHAAGDILESELTSQLERIAIDPEKTRQTFCSTFVLPNQCVIECAAARPDMGITPSLLLTVAEQDEAEPEPVPAVVDTCRDDTDDDDYEPPRRVQRCSSLKTGKTPPGTPGRKKIVRFADVLGLDLADVRTFLDEIPKVPTSAYEDLPGADLTLGNSTMSRSVDSLLAGYPTGGPRPDRSLVPLFQQPAGSSDFIRRVRTNFVCLENAMVKDMSTCTITGTVRVLNMDFNKSVHIRYTLDSWATFADLQATYVANSCDGFSDTFSFVVHGNGLEVGQRIEFAVRFQCHGAQYWDNNNGMNYVFQCLPPATAGPFLSLATDSSERWASFY